jgi:hypothetical protein
MGWVRAGRRAKQSREFDQPTVALVNEEPPGPRDGSREHLEAPRGKRPTRLRP